MSTKPAQRSSRVSFTHELVQARKEAPPPSVANNAPKVESPADVPVVPGSEAPSTSEPGDFELKAKPWFHNLPSRTTPEWKVVDSVRALDRQTVLDVITGQIPVGLMPFEPITEQERKDLIEALELYPRERYDNTGAGEKVFTIGGPPVRYNVVPKWNAAGKYEGLELEKAPGQGKKVYPFVDSSSLEEYLTAPRDARFEALTAPLLERTNAWFRSLGFEVAPFIDPVTKLPWPTKVIREISVPAGCVTDQKNACTVAHVDDIVRDGLKKPDFRLPEGLDINEYHQFSLCIALEDGGFAPDFLKVHNLRYSPELEAEFVGWRASTLKRLGKAKVHQHLPALRQGYMFCTQMVHDVVGGDPRAKRINFSTFYVFVPSSNTLFYYN